MTRHGSVCVKSELRGVSKSLASAVSVPKPFLRQIPNRRSSGRMGRLGPVGALMPLGYVKRGGGLPHIVSLPLRSGRMVVISRTDLRNMDRLNA